MAPTWCSNWLITSFVVIASPRKVCAGGGDKTHKMSQVTHKYTGGMFKLLSWFRTDEATLYCNFESNRILNTLVNFPDQKELCSLYSPLPDEEDAVLPC